MVFSWKMGTGICAVPMVCFELGTFLTKRIQMTLQAGQFGNTLSMAGRAPAASPAKQKACRIGPLRAREILEQPCPPT
jgi:hypothetical protein